MNTAQKTLAALLLFTTMSAEKCSKPSSTEATLLGNRWNLETLGGKPYHLPDGVEKPYIQVSGDGALSGFGGCNRLMGSVKAEGQSVEFPGLGGTKMLCPAVQDVEHAFMDALRKTAHYRIQGDQLTLEGSSGELATLSKGK